MKTTIEFFLSDRYNLNDCKTEEEYTTMVSDIYNKEYAKDGYIIDTDDMLSKTYDHYIALNVGDLVDVQGIQYKVETKELYLDIDLMTYLLSDC